MYTKNTPAKAEEEAKNLMSSKESAAVSKELVASSGADGGSMLAQYKIDNSTILKAGRPGSAGTSWPPDASPPSPRS